MATTAEAAQVGFSLGGLYEKQRKAVWDPARLVFIEASTKSGKTEGCTLWLAEQALTHGKPGRLFWWLAPSYRQAEIAFQRMQNRLPGSVYVPNLATLTLRLVNGAAIEFRTAEVPDKLYGFETHAIVLDEASRMREEAWHAARSTLTVTRGPVRAIGNVRGKKNWFYMMSRRAEVGEKGMAFHRLTAYDAVNAGVIDAEEIEEAKRHLPEAVFRELYLAEASDDGSNPFGLEAIRACIRPGLSEKPPKHAGVDLARSVDFTAIVILDAEGNATTVDHFQQPWAETMERVRDTVGKVPALIDATGVGDPVVEDLQRRFGMIAEGFKYSSQSKQALMERLALAIQRGEVGFPDGPIVSELEAFEYEWTRTGVRYSAPSGFHDDLVNALALAVYRMPVRRLTPVTLPPSDGRPSRWQGMDNPHAGFATGGPGWTRRYG